MTLFSYQTFPNLPPEIVQADAGDILDHAYMQRFITDGAPNIAHFSDYFRYRMFASTDFIWADTDMFALGRFAANAAEDFVVLEDERHVCNALLRIRSDSPALRAIVRGCEAILDKDRPWAFTQTEIDKALKGRLGSLGTAVKRAPQHLPILVSEFYKLILPEFAEECERRCSGAKTVHLYNNILDRIGVYKHLLPPQGSYLHGLFMHPRTCDFVGVYPAAVMRKLVEGWHLRFNGEAIGLRTVARQFFPSIRRTVRRLHR